MICLKIVAYTNQFVVSNFDLVSLNISDWPNHRLTFWMLFCTNFSPRMLHSEEILCSLGNECNIVQCKASNIDLQCIYVNIKHLNEPVELHYVCNSEGLWKVSFTNHAWMHGACKSESHTWLGVHNDLLTLTLSAWLSHLYHVHVLSFKCKVYSHTNS